MSACAATTRSSRSPCPPIITGGCGRCTGLGSHTAPVSWMVGPAKSNGSSSVHIRRMTSSDSPRSRTAWPGGTSGTP